MSEYRVIYYEPLDRPSPYEGGWHAINGLSWVHLAHCFERGIVWDVEVR